MIFIVQYTNYSMLKPYQIRQSLEMVAHAYQKLIGLTTSLSSDLSRRPANLNLSFRTHPKVKGKKTQTGYDTIKRGISIAW